MLVKPPKPPDDKEPPLEERALTELDVEAIERALSSKRPVGWVHAMGMARKIQELEARIAELEGHGQAGRHSRGRGT
jgi:hypothetical protein